MLSSEDFDIKFTSREVSAWGGLVLLKKMMDGMGVFRAIQSWGRLSNRNLILDYGLSIWIRASLHF